MPLLRAYYHAERDDDTLLFFPPIATVISPVSRQSLPEGSSFRHIAHGHAIVMTGCFRHCHAEQGFIYEVPPLLSADAVTRAGLLPSRRRIAAYCFSPQMPSPRHSWRCC